MILHIATLVFFIAQVMGYITWPWVLVFMPSIIALGIFLVLLLVPITMAFIASRL